MKLVCKKTWIVEGTILALENDEFVKDNAGEHCDGLDLICVYGFCQGQELFADVEQIGQFFCTKPNNKF